MLGLVSLCIFFYPKFTCVNFLVDRKMQQRVFYRTNQPPLCKGRCPSLSRAEGLFSKDISNNPSVSRSQNRFTSPCFSTLARRKLIRSVARPCFALVSFSYCKFASEFWTGLKDTRRLNKAASNIFSAPVGADSIRPKTIERTAQLRVDASVILTQSPIPRTLFASTKEEFAYET